MMKTAIGLAVLAFATGTLFGSMVTAAPLAPEPQASTGLIVPASGCHGDVRTHFVPEVSGEVPHFHTGGDCRPIAAEEERRGGDGRRGRGGRRDEVDCHRDVERHFVPGHGRIYHSHRGRSCRIILAEEPRARDCHEDVRLHFVPGEGEIYHSHRGPSCRVVEYERHRGPARSDCITIGPVTVCP